ncbi:MAG: hypothetical protein IJ087_17300 [Eggerthellaceae bacterium]|nr:hypothetical protein [Eggerthellaceae bacterium]
MKGPVGFGKLVNLLMNLAMGLIVSIAVLLSSGAPLNDVTIVPAWLSSFVLGYAAGDIVPISKWCNSAAAHVSRGSRIIAHLIISLFMGIYFGMVILAGNSIINALPGGDWLAVGSFFISNIVTVLVTAVVTVCIILQPMQIFAAKISGFNPNE